MTVARSETGLASRIESLFSDLIARVRSHAEAAESTRVKPVVKPTIDYPEFDEYQLERLGHVFYEINKLDGPVIDPDPLTQILAKSRTSETKGK